MGINSAESFIPPVQSKLLDQEVHVSNRPAHGNRKIGASGETSYETHPVAPQEPLEGARVTGKGDSKDFSPAPSVVGQGGKCPTRTTPASFVSCPPSLYRSLK